MKARRLVSAETGKVRAVKVVPSRRCGKLAYSSKKLALSQAAIARRETGERIEAYKCRNGCHCWHLGHPPGLPRLLEAS